MLSHPIGHWLYYRPYPSQRYNSVLPDLQIFQETPGWSYRLHKLQSPQPSTVLISNLLELGNDCNTAGQAIREISTRYTFPFSNSGMGFPFIHFGYAPNLGFVSDLQSFGFSVLCVTRKGSIQN